jgi:hypothetical protein
MDRCAQPKEDLLPLSAMAAVLTASHHVFELSSGIGLVLQPELGLAGASLVWGIGLPAWVGLASTRRPRSAAVLAVASGTALAGALVHFILWPSRRGRLGLPVLTEAEGLPTASLPAYTAILYAWGGVAAASILLEVPRRSRRWALLGLVTIPMQLVSARHHFRWLTRQAADHPAWWNRAVAEAAPLGKPAADA